MVRSLWLWWLFALCHVPVVLVSSGFVKILEGVERKSEKDDSKLEYSPPAPFPGPPALAFLQGSCLTSSFDRYEYSVCPFQNVTQRRTTAVKPQLLGVWGRWRTTNSLTHHQKIGQKKKSTHNAHNSKSSEAEGKAEQVEAVPEASGDSSRSYYNIMEFANGKNCGVATGIATVYIDCEHDNFEIKSIDSESNCEYALTIGLPISCEFLRAD